ncbi:MAG: CDP-diacylglycerol---glycerol-3-phosphate 3-phosphatidyltransferase [Actinomycetota bacterium]|nr:CDP-diacylglycerol---glycerol-3-phosphate 3-phosphatidyltransferase [Actinomycetota bacterium]HQZ85479.1 CDP-alcohol phosphatidyltransferase family protein [Actinomycetota bacterium]
MSADLSRDAYFARWSDLHGGIDPRANRLVAFWLGIVHALARPLAAAGVSPNGVTWLGGLLSVGVVAAAWAGGGWLLLAAVLVFGSGIVDNLDGAIAVMTGRSTDWGYVLDSLVDRVADVLYLIALFVVGAPGWLCVLAAVLTFLQEYARARAGATGMSEVGVVSVWERPTRVLVTGMFLLAAFIHQPSAVTLVTLAAAVSGGLAIVGLTQVVVSIRRRLGSG